MKILKYKNKYFDDVLAIYNQLFPRLSDEQLDFEINKNPFSELYLIGKNENIVGFVQYYDQQDNYEIAYIGVLKKYQRQKNASKLLSFLVEQAKDNDLDNINLEVRTKNKDAIKLYQKFGFQIATTRKKYYANGDDAYLMMKGIE